jgi:hypothetical protein
LVYTKDGRYATIDISPKTNFKSFVEGSYGSDVMISMVHPDAIAVQNPYQELEYKNLPGVPKLQFDNKNIPVEAESEVR